MKQLREYNAVAEEGKILLTRCRTAIEGIDPSAEVILYGSRARGDEKPESDYALRKCCRMLRPLVGDECSG